MYVSLTEIFNKSSEAFGQVYDKTKPSPPRRWLSGRHGLDWLIDRLVPNPRETLDPHDPAFQENKRRHIARVGMMAAFAITAHNFPEGLATFFATLKTLRSGYRWRSRLRYTIFRRHFHCRARLFRHPQPQKPSSPVSLQDWPNPWARFWATPCLPFYRLSCSVRLA